MSCVKYGVARKPKELNDPWRAMLLNNHYDQITHFIEHAYGQATRAEEADRVALLAAVKELCDSCIRVEEEISFHQQASRHSETRRDRLEAELNKLLHLVELTPQTAASPPQNNFWQHMSRLWSREKPGAAPSPGPAPPERPYLARKQNGTAVAAPPLPPPKPSPEPAAEARPLRPQLTIYCLGAFRVFEDEHPIEEWPSRKGKAILKYLLLHRQQRITKDVLMAQFWPESSADAARNNLNVAIYGLRQALRNGYPTFSHVLFQDDCYFLNPEIDVWIDVEQFAALYKRGGHLLQLGETAAALQEFHAAEALYQGELLAEDPYEEWPAARRQQLQEQYMQLLTQLNEHYFAAEQYATCITYANKLLRVEPCHEATHCLLMRAYARQRQSYLALRQYHTCVELLAEELAVPPNPATTRLYEAIRQHQTV